MYGIFLPTTSSTACITSRTDLPLPVPALNLYDGPPFISDSTAAMCTALRQIAYVYIISNTGPIRCRVVFPIRYRFTAFNCSEQKWNQVSFRLMLFAKARSWFGSVK